MTKHVYVAFKLESVYSISQLKYGSRQYDANSTFNTLRENLEFRNVLKQRIDDICTLLNLNISDDKALIINILSNNTKTQEIVFPIFGIHLKVFGSRIGEN